MVDTSTTSVVSGTEMRDLLADIYYQEVLRRSEATGSRDFMGLAVEVVQEMKDGLQPERYIAVQQT